MKPRTVKLPKTLRIIKFVRWYVYKRERGKAGGDYYHPLDDFFTEVMDAAKYGRNYDATR